MIPRKCTAGVGNPLEDAALVATQPGRCTVRSDHAAALLTSPDDGSDRRRRPSLRRGSQSRRTTSKRRSPLLGAMLLSRDAIAVAVEQVRGGGLLQAVARAHLLRPSPSLYARVSPLTPSPSPRSCAGSASSTRSGGAAALVALQVEHPGDLERRAATRRIVEEHALLRRLIGVAHEIAEIGYEAPRRRHRSASTRPRRWSSTSPSAAPPTRSRSLQDLLSREPRPSRGALRTGRDDHRRADRLTASSTSTSLGPAALQPVVVGARPSMGKTAFALGLAAHAASHRGRPGAVLLARDEPPRDRPARAVRRGPRRRSPSMRNGRLLDGDWPKISSAIGRIGNAPAAHRRQPERDGHGHPGQGPADESADGLGLVVVDYLQLMTGRHVGREPPGRDLRDQPRAEDPRPRARRSRSSR